MLSESRRHGDGAQIDLAATETTRRAIDRLAQSPLTYQAMIEAASLLSGRPADRLLRDAIAWVNGVSPAGAGLVPPPSSAVEGLLRDLAAFAARTDVSPWTRQAIAYYQFIHIHPFADGNGRYSRVLVAASGEPGAAGRNRALLVATALTFHRKAFVLYFDDMQNGVPDRYLARWQAMHHWSHDFARRLASHEAALHTRLSEILGSARSGSAVFAVLCDTAALSTSVLAGKLNWSAKLSQAHVDRLCSAGWLQPSGTMPGLHVCPPIADARRSLLRGIRSETLPLLSPPGASLRLVTENNSQ